MLLPIFGLLAKIKCRSDLLAVQGTLKSLLQHSSKATILLRSAFFMVQCSHQYITTGKTIGLTTCNFVGKVISLLFNMLPRFFIAFLPKSKCLNFMAEVSLCSNCFYYLHSFSTQLSLIRTPIMIPCRIFAK